MGMRIRKLARELSGSPGEVLGLLQELGFGRFRSPEDMLSTALVDRVRSAWKKGVRGAPVAVAARSTSVTSGGAQDARGDDLMAQLVPGVVREQASSTPSRARAVDEAIPLTALAGPDPHQAGLDELRAELARERKELDAAHERYKALEADRKRREAVIAAELAGMERSLIQLQEERAELDQERAALEQVRGEVADLKARTLSGPPIASVFEQRGLRGYDEMERALLALIRVHRLRELLPHLAVTDVRAAERLLREVLVLVGGEVPEALPASRAGLQVAPERADLPGWEVLHRDLVRVGEQLMLNGFTQVLVVGGQPHWQRLLREGVDERVALRFVAELPADHDAHAVLFWGTAGGHNRVPNRVEIPDDTLPSLVRAVRAALAGD